MEASLSVSLCMYLFFLVQYICGVSQWPREESACSAGDSGSIPGSRRSPGEGNGYLLQYSCLENPMDRRAWQATVHGVAKSRTRLKHLSTVHIYAYIWRREWLSTPVDRKFLPREFCGPRTMVGCINPWGPKESDTIEQLILSFSFPDWSIYMHMLYTLLHCIKNNF